MKHTLAIILVAINFASSSRAGFTIQFDERDLIFDPQDQSRLADIDLLISFDGSGLNSLSGVTIDVMDPGNGLVFENSVTSNFTWSLGRPGLVFHDGLYSIGAQNTSNHVVDGEFLSLFTIQANWANVTSETFDLDLELRDANRNLFIDISQEIEVIDGQITIAPQVPVGDFNKDGQLGAEDIDLLSALIRQGVFDAAFDLDSDEMLNNVDRSIWVEEIRKTYFGDANLDGEFNTTDLIQVFAFGQYEDSLVGNSSWESGDWNGDGEFSSQDLIVVFQENGFERGPRIDGLRLVPEPNSLAWCPALLILWFVQDRRTVRYLGR